MIGKDSNKSSRLFMIVPFINLILLIISNALVFWTWFKIFNSDSDTMFLGLFLIPLLAFTIYYLILLRWGFRLVTQRFESTNKGYWKALTLFLINVVPLILIYYFTT